jgi:hypothetical protein
MKLPDYTACVEIRQLLTGMGITTIPALPAIRFERKIIHQVTHAYIDPEDEKISGQLAHSVMLVDKSDIASGPDAFLEYKGRKVAAYIRDQKASVDFDGGTSGYRYHLCNCSTMQAMTDIGRKHRYLATRRSDGQFEVHDLTAQPIRSGIVHMHLCRNCITVLREKNKYFTPFTLQKYFDTNDSFVPETIRKTEEVQEIQTYSPKQEDYSREYRKACRYRCQICTVDCSTNKAALHLHHRNGNPADNSRHNLQVLCADCHAGQPMHGHMLKNPVTLNQIAAIKAMREAQGILSMQTSFMKRGIS